MPSGQKPADGIQAGITNVGKRYVAPPGLAPQTFALLDGRLIVIETRFHGSANIFTLSDLAIVTAVAVVAWFFWQNAGFHERANRFAKQHCKSMDVQLLDDTISLVRWRIERDRRGNFALARYYEFEFTVTGDRRYQGQMTFVGSRIKSVELQPHRVP